MVWAFQLPLLLFVVVVGVLSLKTRRSFSRLPPGERKWRILCETFYFLKPTPVGRRGEFMESRLSRFGKIFSTNLMGKTAIISGDAEVNQFIMKNENMGPGWPRSTRKVLGNTSINFLVGEQHKQVRALMLEFLNRDRLRSVFLCDAERSAAAVFGSFSDGSIVSGRREAAKFSFSIMVKETMSVEPEDPVFEELMTAYEWIVQGLLSIPINLPGTKFSKALHARKKILKIIEQRLEGSSKSRKGSENDDLLSWAMKKKKNMKNDYYTKEEIGDLLLFTLFAGQDTTSRAIALMFYFLESNHEAIQQLREEHLEMAALRKRDGKYPLTWDDYKSMKFSNCVINETLRLGGVVKLIVRKTNADVEINGFMIPKGCTMIAHLPSAHLDPSNFNNPTDFNPWRWLETNDQERRKNSFMAFGGGNRMCPGMELARLEMIVFFHYLLLNFEWEIAEPDHPIYSPTIHFPKGLPIKLRKISVNPPL